MKRGLALASALLKTKSDASLVSAPNAQAPYPTLSVAALALAALLVPMVARALEAFAGSTHLRFRYGYRSLWIGAFLLNVLCVSIPGRLDEEMARSTGIESVWRSLFVPAPWAFAIWGVIYLGELCVSVAVGVSGARQVSGACSYWVAGTLYQCLWCLAFRRRFMSALWLPSSMLALGSLCLFGAHSELTDALLAATTLRGRIIAGLIRFPISVHAAWLSAAALLNLNGWAARMQVSLVDQVLLANTSAFLAFIVGAGYTIWSRDSAVGRSTHIQHT